MGLPRQDELDFMLQQTLEDRRLSRTEKRALTEVFADYELNAEERTFIRHRVFTLARECIRNREAEQVLQWAEDVVKILHSRLERDPTISEVHFSPGDECRMTIVRLLKQAQHSVDICVFTITDDRLAEEIHDTHKRGITIRIISDNDKADDIGSDIHRLAQAGVEVCVDESEHHMHHKFAIFDARMVITGSYNWTRSAAQHNRENLVVSDDPKIVGPYQRNFDELWRVLSNGHRLTPGRTR